MLKLCRGVFNSDLIDVIIEEGKVKKVYRLSAERRHTFFVRPKICLQWVYGKWHKVILSPAASLLCELLSFFFFLTLRI